MAGMTQLEGMERLFEDVYRILPTKITPSKYSSLFVRRDAGNLLFSCFGGHSSINGSFHAIESLGGVAWHLLGDMHFAARYNDDVDRRFGTVTQCSELEAPDVQRKVRNVLGFRFARHELTPGVEVIPTPGHRPGAVSFLVPVGGRRCLFVGDSIYHDGKAWRALASKKNRKIMLATLNSLADIEFDVLLANTGATNPVCWVDTSGDKRAGFLDALKDAL